MTKLPDDFFKNFSNLVGLFLPSNDLTSLPPGVGFSRNLKILNLDGNLLTNLPEDIEKLSENLEELIISRNCFSKIPEKCFMLKNLKVLKIEYMMLTEIPEKIGMKWHTLRGTNLDLKYLSIRLFNLNPGWVHKWKDDGENIHKLHVIWIISF